MNRALSVDKSGTASGFEYSGLGDVTGGFASVSTGFDPYGGPESTAVDVGFGYRGELHVGGMVYLRFRDLDPALGRFTTIDPLDGVPGATTVANQYAYGGNDPIGAIDPWGLRATDGTFVLQSDPPVIDPISQLYMDAVGSLFPPASHPRVGLDETPGERLFGVYERFADSLEKVGVAASGVEVVAGGCAIATAPGGPVAGPCAAVALAAEKVGTASDLVAIVDQCLVRDDAPDANCGLTVVTLSVPVITSGTARLGLDIADELGEAVEPAVRTAVERSEFVIESFFNIFDVTLPILER